MSEYGFKVKVKVGDIKKGLREIEDYFKKATTDAMTSNVDSGFDYSWLDSGGLLESPDKWSDHVRGPGQANKALVNQIKDLYIDAWDKKYTALQRAYQSARSSTKSGVRWIKWKERHANEASPWNESERILPAGQATWGIMTGYLKRSVSEAFESGSTKDYMKVDNLAIRGVWQNNLDAYQTTTPYIAEITRYYVNELGILSNEDHLTQLDYADLVTIGSKMLALMKPNFITPLVRDLNDLNIHIPGPKG